MRPFNIAAAALVLTSLFSDAAAAARGKPVSRHPAQKKSKPPESPAARSSNGTIAYVRLPHSPGASGLTALLIPRHFDTEKPAIIAPYFHGHGGGIGDSLNRQRLQDIANNSKKNIVFVIPQLGPRSDIKDEFATAFYAESFLKESSQALARIYSNSHPAADKEKTKQTFDEMPVVVVSYSGGYLAARCLLEAPRVKGIFLLDSIYESAVPFINFANRPDTPFVVNIYTHHTQEYAEDLSRAVSNENIYGFRTNRDHAVLVQDFMAGFLKNLALSQNGLVRYGETDRKAANGVLNSSPVTCCPVVLRH